ncbi:hypothetical protein INT44_002130 [Umbelopsis vinacea]|uniref:Uncharacterized protein n=1 Tax=Umbelopsis vinacea TaxID=44442 RepID=A0A8H7Q4U5_9FUNG|nr:hypothetical protein INT44_002130 [Umbelopsis vinacea]
MVKNSKSSDTAQLYDGDVAEFVSALNREDCVQMMNVEYFPKDAYATIPPNRTVSIHLKTVEELPEWFKKRIMNIEMAN